MWHDFDAIPEAEGRREGVGSMLTRIYHEIGLAAVADALDLTDRQTSRAISPSRSSEEYHYLCPIAPGPRASTSRPEGFRPLSTQLQLIIPPSEKQHDRLPIDDAGPRAPARGAGA